MRMSFLNSWYDHESDRGRHIRIDRLHLRDLAGNLVAAYELEDLDPTSDCNHPVGDHHFALHCNGSVDVIIAAPVSGNYTLEFVVRADHAGDELPRLDVAVLDETLSGDGATAIRNKLVELYDKLLGVEVMPYSPEVNSAFELFVNVAERGSSSEEVWFDPRKCGFWHDKHFFDGIVDDILIEKQNEWGPSIDFDYDRVNSFFRTINFSDVHYTARAWVVVLSYLLMDYRYLYL